MPERCSVCLDETSGEIATTCCGSLFHRACLQPVERCPNCACHKNTTTDIPLAIARTRRGVAALTCDQTRTPEMVTLFQDAVDYFAKYDGYQRCEETNFYRVNAIRLLDGRQIRFGDLTDDLRVDDYLSTAQFPAEAALICGQLIFDYNGFRCEVLPGSRTREREGIVIQSRTGCKPKTKITFVVPTSICAMTLDRMLTELRNLFTLDIIVSNVADKITINVDDNVAHSYVYDNFCYEFLQEIIYAHTY